MSTLTAIAVAAVGEEAPRERLARLFDAQHGRLYRFALRMARNDDEALDLVQEAFLRAARAPKQVPEDDGDAGAWLVRIVVNLLRDRHRRALVREAFARTLKPGSVAHPAEAIDARAAVRGAIASLPPRQRAIVVLHELEDRDVADIARELGVTAVTVRWHLAAARKRLALLLAPYGDPRS